MAKRGGMFRQPKKARGHGVAAGGGGVNPNMLRQAQALQAQFQEAQEELKQATVSASAGGGVISVEMGGDRKLLKVSIDPDALDPDDHELVEDLFMAAVNEATDKLEALQQERLGASPAASACPGSADRRARHGRRPAPTTRRRHRRPLARLIDAFHRLPGIGPKSAQRLAYHVLRAPEAEAHDLAEALLDIKQRIHLCAVCQNLTESDPCGLCDDPSRDPTRVCVVEEPLDVLAVERAGAFRGRYHVLHGHLSPMDGVGPEQLKVQQLLARLGAADGAPPHRRGDPRHQLQPRGRSHRGLPRPADRPPRRPRDAHRPRPAHGLRRRIRRRTHPAPGPRTPRLDGRPPAPPPRPIPKPDPALRVLGQFDGGLTTNVARAIWCPSTVR